MPVTLPPPSDNNPPNNAEKQKKSRKYLDNIDNICNMTAMEAKPVAVVPDEPRELGRDVGSFEVPEDFNDPLPSDVLEAVEGSLVGRT